MMTWPFRILFFIILALCFLYGSYVIGLIGVTLLGINRPVYEYIPLAFCIDCYFSPEPIMFWYTGVITSIVFFGILLQPFIRRNQIRE